MKVLVVDDERPILRLLKQYLSEYCDCEVTTAEDGQKGFDLYNKSPHHYELVITDINLPKLDGLSLVNRIKDVDNVPIICITGHSDLEEDAKVSGLNIVKVLTKPFELKELDCLISKIKNKKKS